MRHRRAGKKLGRSPAHRWMTLRNLVTNLLERERITTTLPKAKALRPLAEKMISLGKRDSLHTRRQAAAFLLSAAVVKKLFDTIAPRFADRPGGYLRIIKAGWRISDGAELAIVELIGSELKKKKKKLTKKERRALEAKERSEREAQSGEAPEGEEAS